jgi:hypothetical protein
VSCCIETKEKTSYIHCSTASAVTTREKERALHYGSTKADIE